MKEETNKKEDRLEKLFWEFLSPIITGLISGIILLAIEYKNSLDISINNFNYWVVFGELFFLAMGFSYLYGAVKIGFNESKFVREQFSALATLCIFVFSLVAIFSASTRLMPWYVPETIILIINRLELVWQNPPWSEYVVLILAWLVFYIFLRYSFYNWGGQKSINQYKREQGGKSSDFLIEGIRELSRVLRRGAPLQVYKETRNYHPQLDIVVDSIAWRDQAKELLKLSSSSYAFDDESWHDRYKCWVGSNLNTDELVFLFPCQDISTEESELSNLLSYVEKISRNERKQVGEIIVATRNAPLKKSTISDGVRLVTEAELLENLVDFKDYFNYIKRRVSSEKLPDSDLSLDDVYVPSHAILQNGSSHENIESYLTDWLRDHSQRHIAVLGEYGQGKSTATLMWAYHLINSKNFTRIPLLIELRGTSPRNLTPLQLLGAWASQFNINPQSLMKLHIAGKLVLIFEGFDEMALVGDSEMRLKHFRTLWQFAYQKAKIIITGRPNFFLDENEMKSALGISQATGGRPYCDAIRLMPFDKDQVEHSLRNHQPTTREQICLLTQKNNRFMELVSRPSLLHIVAVLWVREQLFKNVDKLTSAYVMDSFIRHSYRRQGLKEKESPDFMALTTNEREYFMSGVACYMASFRLPNQITGFQLNQVITDLLNIIPDSVSTSSPAITGETNIPLKGRIMGNEYAVEHIRTDVRACGILVDDPANPGTFRFGHKSFMEYLFAEVVSENLLNPKNEVASTIFTVTNSSIEDILRLPVSVEFLAELLGQKIKNTIEGTLSEEKINQRVAFRLFDSLVARNSRFALSVSRFFSFLEASIYLMGIKSRRSGMYIKFVPVFLLMTIMVFYMFRGINSRDTLNSIGFIFLQAATMASMFFVIFSQRFVEPYLYLWFKICRELNVDNSALHFVLGTHFFSRLKIKSFNYDIDSGYAEYLSKRKALQ